MSASGVLSIVQAGDPVLRRRAQPLSTEALASPDIQALIEAMRETMRAAPGVGLAAPQIGRSIALAVIEDRPEYLRQVSPAELDERERKPVPFQVLVNPRLEIVDPLPAEFFEGCLSVAGLLMLVPRARAVRVEALDQHGAPVVVEATGWLARILQHEIDHLHGTLCVDRMTPRTLTTSENYRQYWRDLQASEIRARLAPTR